MDEVVIAPDGGVVVVLPLQVDVQVGQVITFRDSKLLPDLVALLLSALGKETGTFKYRHGEARPIWHILKIFHTRPVHTSICLTIQNENNILK